ncbi:MAG5620 family putative phospho-sugar mutase [Mycoplasmopsis verecunda]|uniref:Uncharacterized protein n=1 Tax=Mycoplasmopsis verecunda TaxID=171291 RepID=A0A1T4KYG4_9BACT|nr:hypothetical protein [Mycoplasmopsis verecunda]WPB54344.1 hypothetical protein SAM46_02535 [Mycoplasmopsis verecunda]SJZ47380.1 hypothetical protein SAMN02745154_00242 [Mycoplasmopsis verecunda]
MQQTEHKLTPWYNLYSNQKLIDFSFEHFVREIDNLFPDNTFYTRPKSTIYGLEFNSLNQYGYGNLNIYTLLNIIDIFESLAYNNTFFKKKARILLATSNDELFSEVLREHLVRFLKNKKHFLYGFNVTKVNNYVFHSAIDSLDIDFAIYLTHNEANNKYYLKIYHGKELISLQHQEEIIDHLYTWKKHLMFHESKEIIPLNINKVIDTNIKNILARYVNRENKLDYYSSLSIYLMLEDQNDEYILDRFFKQINVKYSKLNPLLNKDLLSTSPIVFWRWLRTANYKADLIIILNKNNYLRLIARTKEGYVNLHNDEVAFLYINSQYLYWKENNLLDNHQIYLPMDASEFILSNLENYKIAYHYENEISNPNDVLFAYAQGFSNSLDMKLNFDNLEFLFNFCFMLLNYKENNNLFTFKYKKMTEASHSTYLTTYNLKKNKQDFDDLFEYLLSYPDAFGKYKIKSLRSINFNNTKVHYLFNLKLKSKHNDNNIYISYNMFTKQIEAKFESTTNLYQINQFIEKWYIISVQKKIVRRLNHLVNKLNKLKNK